MDQIQTAEREKAFREQGKVVGTPEGVTDSSDVEEVGKLVANGRCISFVVVYLLTSIVLYMHVLIFDFVFLLMEARAWFI